MGNSIITHTSRTVLIDVFAHDITIVEVILEVISLRFRCIRIRYVGDVMGGVIRLKIRLQINEIRLLMGLLNVKV